MPQPHAMVSRPVETERLRLHLLETGPEDGVPVLFIHGNAYVLWSRGADDQIISDASLLDLGTLGKLGLFPGWPGDAVHPPQPMVSQTRALLERYRQNGGRYREEVLPDCGHSPHLERPADFHRLLQGFLADCLAAR